MCNAWNHPRNCTCGWGGEGHAGKKNSGSHSGYFWVPPIQARYESYVNPNASCPVCGEAVFFYQSPDGGRVFFDELGPPWPKHPCTDGRSIPNALNLNQPPSETAKQFQWQINGWQPMIGTIVIGYDKTTLKISGTINNEDKAFYVNRMVNHHEHEDPVRNNAIIFVKLSPDGIHELSILSAIGKEVKSFAYDTSILARDNIRRGKRTLNSVNTQKKKANASFRGFKQGNLTATLDTSPNGADSSIKHRHKHKIDVKALKLKPEKTPSNPAIAIALQQALLSPNEPAGKDTKN